MPCRLRACCTSSAVHPSRTTHAGSAIADLPARSPQDDGTGYSDRLRRPPASRVHRLEELAVALGVAQLVEQEIDRIHRAHRVEDAAQHIHLLELVGLGEQLFLAGAGPRDVDRREGALVGDLAIEDELRVAGALEFLEDTLVHAAAAI